MTLGSLPLSAIANVIREPANIEPNIWTAADTNTSTDTNNVAPTGPAMILATPEPWYETLRDPVVCENSAEGYAASR
jgi:hypothetical protein